MIGKRSRETEQLLLNMERQMDRIYTALLVRDPGTPMSVEAYEGLRKQVVASATARLQHVAQLAEFDVALRRGASTEDLVALVDQWLRQAGVERIEDPMTGEAWEARPAPDVEAVVDLPAYVDVVTNRLVRQGRLKAKPVPVRPGREIPAEGEESTAVREVSGSAHDDQTAAELPREREANTDPASAAGVGAAGEASRES